LIAKQIVKTKISNSNNIKKLNLIIKKKISIKYKIKIKTKKLTKRNLTQTIKKKFRKTF
jgi:hypothetical protein